MGRPPLKQAYTVSYAKGGIELKRYTITALTHSPPRLRLTAGSCARIRS